MFRDVFELWYRVTFDNIEQTIEGCSDDVWLMSMWSVADDPAKPHAVAPDGSDHPLGDEVLSAVWKMVWHGLGANEFNLYGRPPGFRSSFAPDDPTWTSTEALGSGHPHGEVVPVEPATREEMLAYLAYNRRLVDVSLAMAQEVGGGESTLGPWRGPTSTLLTMFHGNACHLVSHSTEVGTFLRVR